MARKAAGLLLLAGAAFLYANSKDSEDQDTDTEEDPVAEPVIDADGNVVFQDPDYVPPPSTDGQVVFNTNWDVTYLVGYDELRAWRSKYSSKDTGFRTGWNLLFNLKPDSNHTVYSTRWGALPGTYSFYQVWLWQQGWNPDRMYDERKDIFSLIGKLWYDNERAIYSSPTLYPWNWGNPKGNSNYLAVRDFLTGKAFLTPTALSRCGNLCSATIQPSGGTILDEIFSIELTISQRLKFRLAGDFGNWTINDYAALFNLPTG